MNDAIAMPPIILQKPEYGKPCNGCGFCCHEQICGIGKRVFPDAVAPCPALNWQDGKYRCLVVIAEEEMLKNKPEEKPLVKDMLGVGWGCDSRSYDGEGNLIIP